MTEAIVLAVIGSGALSTIISAIITAIGNRKSKLKAIEAKLTKTEKDAVRTQLLLLLSDYPAEHKEILEVAQYYFGVLHSDWYMTSLFNKWIQKQGIAEPEWFDGGEKKK